MSKTNLITSLKRAVHALETDIVRYDWREQQSCNCGVVAQAVLGKSKEEIREGFLKSWNSMSKSDKERRKEKVTETTGGLTWKESIKYTCDITGKTNVEILKNLFSAGLSPEDICHLEYLENKAILERANLYTLQTVTSKVKTGETVITVPVNKTVKAKGLRGFFGGTDIVVVEERKVEETYETKTEQKKILEKEYWSKKPNLIKYLKAWVQILEEETKPAEAITTLNKNQLREELLKAESNQDFEKCAVLRDKIAVMA